MKKNIKACRILCMVFSRDVTRYITDFLDYKTYLAAADIGFSEQNSI